MSLVIETQAPRSADDELALLERTHVRRSRWPGMMALCLAVLLPALIGVLKIGALLNWRYTSDLFMLDTMLQETIRGHFAMEFTNGSQFGEHAWLIFALLLPIKFLLGGRMVFLLVLLPALALSVSGIIVFACARAVAGEQWAALAMLVYFLSPGVLRGPFDSVYGFSIGILSGYAAVAMAFLMLRYEQCRRGRSACLIAIFFFAAIKEEMALLGVCFFLTMILLDRVRRPWRQRESFADYRRQSGTLHRAGLCICLVLFLVEMVLIHVCRTPWNRGNGPLFRFLVDELREDGLFGFFGAFSNVEYWVLIAFVGGLLIWFAVVARRLSSLAAALTVMGLIKLAFAWAVPDFEFWSWHNYPAITMLTGAISIQMLELRDATMTRMTEKARLVITATLVLGFGWFASAEFPFFLRQLHANQRASVRVQRLRPGLAPVLQKVDKSKVVSIPRYAAYAFARAGCRYTFFPRGITGGPSDIADMLVLRVIHHEPPPPEAQAFTLVYHNGHYALYQRTGFLSGEEQSRREFIHEFGRESIGAPAHVNGKARKKKKRQHNHSASRE